MINRRSRIRLRPRSRFGVSASLLFNAYLRRTAFVPLDKIKRYQRWSSLAGGGWRSPAVGRRVQSRGESIPSIEWTCAGKPGSYRPYTIATGRDGKSLVRRLPWKPNLSVHAAWRIPAFESASFPPVASTKAVVIPSSIVGRRPHSGHGVARARPPNPRAALTTRKSTARARLARLLLSADGQSRSASTSSMTQPRRSASTTLPKQGSARS